MKKRIITSLLILTVTLSFAACSSADTSVNDAEMTETQEHEASEDSDISDLDAIGDIEVEDNLFSVELTVPADFVGEATQEDLDATAQEMGYKSITLNDDGSATYVMTKKQHQEMLDGIAESIDQSLNDMVNSEDYPNFTAVSANDNYTEFTVTTTSTELNIDESFSVLGFYMYGGMYAIFSGEDVGNIHVTFINADSGEIISESDSSSMNSDTE